MENYTLIASTKGHLAMQNSKMKLCSYIARDKYNGHFSFVETKRKLCSIEYESCFMSNHYLLIIIMQTCIEVIIWPIIEQDLIERLPNRHV